MTLYNKYRPQTFGDVQGHKVVVDSVTQHLAKGTLSQQHIMAGQKGTGKTTIAKLIAKVLSCESPKGVEPCNECSSCQAADKGAHNDIYEIDGASNNGVDDIRRLKDEIKYPPVNQKYKIYIIDEVHMLSTNAFNALLKTVEEPPSYVIFIFATTELHKIPATVLSRCLIHTFERMDEGVIGSRLEYIAQKENFNLDAEAAAMIAKHADGSMRDSISILSNICHHDVINTDVVMESLGLIDESTTYGFIDSLMSKDSQTAIALYQGILKKGKTASQLIESIIQLLTTKMLMGENVSEYAVVLRKLNAFRRENAQEKNVQLMFNLFIIEYATQVEASGSFDQKVITDLNQKIANLENAFGNRLNRIEGWIKKVNARMKAKSNSQQQQPEYHPPVHETPAEEMQSQPPVQQLVEEPSLSEQLKPAPHENIPEEFTQQSEIKPNNDVEQNVQDPVVEQANTSANIVEEKKDDAHVEKAMVNDILSRLKGFGVKNAKTG